MEEYSEHSEWRNAGKETGFTAPSGYFESLSDEISARIAVQRLKEMVPDPGFAVPENYFSQAETRLMGQIEGRKVLRLWQSKAFKYASAACFVIVAGAGLLFFSLKEKETAPKVSQADIAAEQILFDIDEDVIIEHIEANYKETKPTNTAETELENYILNNYSQSDLASIL